MSDFIIILQEIMSMLELSQIIDQLPTNQRGVAIYIYIFFVLSVCHSVCVMLLFSGPSLPTLESEVPAGSS